MSRPTKPTATDSRERSLLSHFDRIPGLADVPPTVRQQVAQWLLAHGPFDDPAELRRQLAKTGIRGFKLSHQQSIVDSLQPGIMRRPFLAAAVGIGSLASLGTGAWLFLKPAESINIAAPAASNTALGDAIVAGRQTVGQTVRSLVEGQGVQISPSHAAHAHWLGLIHALDMSNWIEAAGFLYGSTLWKRVEPAAKDEAFAAIAHTLLVLHRAWAYLLAVERRWRDEFFIAYAFGKMPALAMPAPRATRFPRDDETAQEHLAAINQLAFTFQALETLNQRFQQPASTAAGAPVRFTQGHNLTYAHASTDLEDAKLFPPARRTVLVNWDAHADLGAPFANPRIELRTPFADLQGAKSWEDRVKIAGFIGEAGWILPLVYEGLLTTSGEAAQLLWIVPKEALATSHNCMEPYGTYTMTVGDWTLPDPASIRAHSTAPVGDWNVPGQTEIRNYSDRATLSSVDSPELLKNQKACQVHIVDPDDTATIEKRIGDAQLFLSGDADYSGTREPGLTPRMGYLPDYPLNATPAEQSRHRQLIGQFGNFYRRYKDQIRSVSIANSPNFTVDEETRKPVAKLLHALVDGRFAGQPAWVESEWNRVAAPWVQPTSRMLRFALTAGGAAGIAAMLGALEWHRRRVDQVRSLVAGSA